MPSITKQAKEVVNLFSNNSNTVQIISYPFLLVCLHSLRILEQWSIVYSMVSTFFTNRQSPSTLIVCIYIYIHIHIHTYT